MERSGSLVFQLAAAIVLAALGPFARADPTTAPPPEPPGPQLSPANGEETALGRATMREYFRALRTREFRDFIALWGKETQANVKDHMIGGPFFLKHLERLEPKILVRPKTHPDRMLELEAAYPIGANELRILLRFYREDDRWALIHVWDPGIEPSPPPPIPEPQEIDVLVQETFGLFVSALEQRDFRNLHEKSSSLLRAGMTPDDLSRTYQWLIESGKDSKKLAASLPIWDDKPLIDTFGMLKFHGHYPTSPEQIQFTIYFLFEDGGWKFCWLDLHFELIEIGPVPEADDMKRMVDAELGMLVHAIRSRDYRAFREHLADAWRLKQTPESLAEKYGVLDAVAMNLPDMKSDRPKFTEPPRIDDQRTLVARGFVNTETNHLTYELRFLYESCNWKLSACEVSLRDGLAPKPPVDDQIRFLLEAVLSDLNESIARDDFETFHRGLSEPFRGRCNPEQLRGMFADFIEKRLYLGNFHGANAILTEAPRVDHEDVLHLVGYIPAGNRRLSFRLEFLWELPEGWMTTRTWRLHGINAVVE